MVILPEDNSLKRKIKEAVEDGPCLVPDEGIELKIYYGTASALVMWPSCGQVTAM